MKISRAFVKFFLVLLLVIVVGNIAGMVFGFYKAWMAYSTLAFFVALFFLVFRKNKVGFVKILAWVIPIVFILGVLYVNFMPFGYSYDYTINVSSDGSVHSSSSRLYFEDAKGKVITNLSNIYSLGYVNLVLKPRIVLRNANVSASINGTDVHFAELNLGANNKWDYMWNFSKTLPSGSPLWGSAKYDSEKGCYYFNASQNQTLSYFKSADMFESASFVVYAKWKPENVNGANQQIVGHYNWELWQSNNSVRFMIGRLDDKNGSMPSISLPINESFFNKTHEALGVYLADNKNSTGYIDLYVDGNFVERRTINGSVIWGDYNSDRDLTFGWSPHKDGSYFQGCIYQVGFDYGNINSAYLNNLSYQISGKAISLPVVGSGNLSSIKLSIKK